MALAQIRLATLITALHNAVSPADGAVLQELGDSIILTDGTGDFQADRVALKAYTIAGSGSQDVDLTTITDAYGTAIGITETVAVLILNIAYLSDGVTASGGTVTMTPHATNGWTGLLAAAGDIAKIAPGGSLQSTSPRAGLAVSGTSKVITLGNANSGSCYVKILVLGRSA